VTLRLVAGRWLVAGDVYFDDLAPHQEVAARQLGG
jgi:hypothetical protein